METKEVIVLDPTKTDPAEKMKIKHKALAKKFQYRFCNRFKDMLGAGLVETTGWTFLYPLMPQHKPCTREESGVYIVHYILGFTGFDLCSVLSLEKLDHLRKKIPYEIVTMKGKKGDLPGFLCEEIID